MGKSEPADSQRFVIEIPDGVERGMAFKYIIRLVSGYTHPFPFHLTHSTKTTHTRSQGAVSYYSTLCAILPPAPHPPPLSLPQRRRSLGDIYVRLPFQAGPVCGGQGPCCHPRLLLCDVHSERHAPRGMDQGGSARTRGCPRLSPDQVRAVGKRDSSAKSYSTAARATVERATPRRGDNPDR